MSVGIRPGPSCRRPDVVTGDDGAAPTPLQVKYYAPDEQSDDWDENDQQDGHHNLLPEVFSAYVSQASPGDERCIDSLHVKIPESSRSR
jgi:hypothetical protein